MNIAEFAQRCELTPHTLRYYERIGLLGQIARQANGHRVFGARDVEWVAFLQRLRATGMPIREMLRYAALRAEGPATVAERKALLEAHAARLDARLRAQQANLRAVKQKIALYESQLRETALT
jgi:DNA-binding transcriptional MerR regulator